MMPDVSSNIKSLASLTESERQLLRTIYEQMAEEWRNGNSPNWLEQVQNVPESLRACATAQLLHLELQMRSERGEKLSLADYCQRFPEWKVDLPGWIEDVYLAQSDEKSLSDQGTLTSAPIETPVGSRPSPVQMSLGEYDLIQPLGQGGMGQVYEAIHRRLQKRVAIKVIRLDHQDNQQLFARFEREIKAAGQMHHPHLIEAHDAGEQDGQLYLVMEFLQGTDLKQYIQQHGPMTPIKACELVRQAAMALQHLHEKGLVHRDVKPSNLMLTPEGQIKLLDLGLARWQAEREGDSSLTAQGCYLGTPDFLAPEQIENVSQVDIRADLYGLGGVLFYLLTGQPPFAESVSLQAKVDAHRSQIPNDVRQFRQNIPAAVASLVSRLLSKNPSERFSIPEELAQEINLILSALRSGDDTTILMDKKNTNKSKKRSIITSIAFLIILFLLLFLTQPWRSSNRNDPHVGQKILVNSFEIRHRKQGGDFPLIGKVGEISFRVKEGDAVTLDVQLSDPAFCFIIGFYPNGNEELIFPENEDTIPSLTKNPKYPIHDPTNAIGMIDGTGLEAFFVVVSRNPLPPYREWRKELGPPPWKSMKVKTPQVWEYRAEGLQVFDENNPKGNNRGKGAKVLGPDVLIYDMVEWLKKASEIENIAGICFPVFPKK